MSSKLTICRLHKFVIHMFRETFVLDTYVSQRIAARSVNVIALVWSILVIGKAFLLGYATATNDACLQVDDHGIDLRGGERDAGRIQIVRRGPQRSSVACADLVGPLI